MSEQREDLIEKINRAIVKCGVDSKKRIRLGIILRRYIDGERSPDLINAIKIETE